MFSSFPFVFKIAKLNHRYIYEINSLFVAIQRINYEFFQAQYSPSQLKVETHSSIQSIILGWNRYLYEKCFRLDLFPAVNFLSLSSKFLVFYNNYLLLDYISFSINLFLMYSFWKVYILLVYVLFSLQFKSYIDSSM